jgi:Peptidase family M23
MTTHCTTSSRGSRRPPFWSTALGALLAGVVAAVLLMLAPSRDHALPTAAAATPSQAHRPAGSAPSTYGWPVKPFDREHPVRAILGDPRTIFKGQPTVQGLLHSGGDFSFHQGIDISAPDGTDVYPVMSGVVTAVVAARAEEHVEVDSGNGHFFEYWHIRARVAVGDHVTARRTVLGQILRPAMHVHLTEYLDGKVVNPLAPGHLGPYTDTTAPKVTAIGLLPTGAEAEQLPSFVRGRIRLVASAIDLPTKPVPGIWGSLPTTPARLTWRIQSWNGRHVVVDEQTAYDHRSTIPSNADFWRTYARGTYQNMAVFGSHYSYLQAGSYVFNLTPRPFDTRSLPDGVYDLVVTATDIRGNSGSATQRFTVHNRAGWRG